MIYRFLKKVRKVESDFLSLKSCLILALKNMRFHNGGQNPYILPMLYRNASGKEARYSIYAFVNGEGDRYLDSVSRFSNLDSD